MINNEAFTKRLKKVIEFYGETASSFAEKVGVQRSSISHLLSGRNKPSLEFVLKILASYPEVELYWLLNGKGIFPSKNISAPKIEENQISKKDDLFSATENETKLINENTDVKQPTFSTHSKKEIERIVIFYKDGTFSNFKN